MYSMDKDWWTIYGDEVVKDFIGARYSNNPVKQAQHLANFEHFGNSGAACISLAISGGASRVVLLGYDCQVTNGLKHWHGDHPKGLGNAGMIHKWHKRFAELADKYPNKVFNATRETALTCFERVKLEDEITN
jgi:hypothetical protein